MLIKASHGPFYMCIWECIECNFALDVFYNQKYISDFVGFCSCCYVFGPGVILGVYKKRINT